MAIYFVKSMPRFFIKDINYQKQCAICGGKTGREPESMFFLKDDSSISKSRWFHNECFNKMVEKKAKW